MRHNMAVTVNMLTSTMLLLICTMVLLTKTEAQKAPKDPTVVFSNSSQPDGDLWLMDPNGDNMRPLIDLALKAKDQPLGVRWSPDGKTVAFHTRLDGNIDIFAVNADGNKLRRLSQDDAEDAWPCWHPTGQRLAFATNRDGNFEIYTMNVHGHLIENLTNDPARDIQPDWSSDGRKIAFATKRGKTLSDIYTMDADGENLLNLTKHRGDDSYPRWSPDNQRIAWVSRRNGTGDIHTMDPDGENVENLTPGPRCDMDPSWSPDGESFVFSDAPFVELAVMDADKPIKDAVADGKVLFGGDWQGSRSPDWFDPDFAVAFAVSPDKRQLGTWAWIKHQLQLNE